MTFFYFHTLICLPDELPPQSDVPMCIYYLPSLLILSFYIILLLQQFQKLFFRKRLGKIIALDHLDSPAADLFHFFLCFHPFGNNMIIHFMKCFYNTFLENCPFLIPADIKKQRSVNLDHRKRKPHYRIQIRISGTKIIQTQTNASVRKFLRNSS